MRCIATITILLLTALCTKAQQIKRASFYKGSDNQIKEVYHLSDTTDNILQGEYTSYFMNGNIEKAGSYDEGYQEGKWRYYYENGKKKMEGELEAGDPNGYWTYYFENGNKRMEGKLVGDMREGEWVIYYQNGEVRRKGNFVEGLHKGLWYYYYEDEILKGKVDFYENRGKYTEYYRSGNIRAKGEKIGTRNQGKWTYYYENGARLAEGNYSKGKKSGTWIYYHPDQQVSSSGQYENDKATGQWNYYHSNGVLQSTGTFDQGKKEGAWSLFDDLGQLKGKGDFHQGNGFYIEYYPDGKVRVKGFMDNGISKGKWLYYYPDGKLEGECGFINGKGLYTGYYRNGTTKLKGRIERDKKVGTWEMYGQDGELTGYYKPYYERDTPQEMLAVGPVIRQNFGVADYRFRSRRFKYFEGRVNEFNGVILGGNPALSLIGNIPVSLEFYTQERLGYEFEFVLLRNPFFKKDINVPIDDIFKRGYTIAVKQKFYNPDDKFGMWYFGHGAYFTNLTHFANIQGQNNGSFTTSSEENKIEYGAIFGYRMKVRTGEKGFTIDGHVGMAVGYRSFDISTIQPQAFEFLEQSRFSNTFRAGVNIGYVFAARKQGRR